MEEDGSPYWGAGEKHIWLSIWHATVRTLGDQTVGGGNANSNLQPLYKQTLCHNIQIIK
jgi:hypothetical protein